MNHLQNASCEPAMLLGDLANLSPKPPRSKLEPHRELTVDELKRASLIMRAQSYRRRLFSEFDRTKEVFLP